MSVGKPNVIIIVLDTLRKDHSRGIERLLTRDFGFTSIENAITTSPWTIPSHASMFTGLYPLYHGVHEGRKRKVPDVRFREDGTYLHEVLGSLGYTTYLLTANFFVGPDFGIRAFDEFRDTLKPLIEDRDREELNEVLKKHEPRNALELTWALVKERKFTLPFKIFLRIVGRYGEGWPRDKGAKVTERLLSEMELKRPVYMFINLMEVHEPYSIFEGFTDAPVVNRLLGEEPELVEKWRKGYPRQVEYLEKRLREMMETLEDRNLMENSVIVVTSDHGQLLGEDNRLGHGVFLDDELLRVPLLIKAPHEIGETGGYVSLARIKPFILSQVEGKDFQLASEYALAESFGTHYPYPNLPEEKLEAVKELEKYRIKLYHREGTAVFNVDDWKLEGVESEAEDFERKARRLILRHLSLLTGGRVAG
ncbi:sulfatase-like hydrolase/transferase [Thermococcus sp. MV11]|uniref:sulfatase-like hydrolase/transferase n=1 Tax=Thermococcus sp. MV11 TaxID=1638267 RepID=UPI00143030DE|nr:sulfatase-like hydrolase/transferase [Thermococcus sp. MV11]NJE04319.1 hypothetical protein [Thermococcus sp. MV11]